MGWGFHFFTFALRWFIFSLGYSWSFAVQDVCFYQCLINRGYGADDRSRSRVIFHSLFQVSPKVERTGPRERQQRVAKFLLTAPIKSFHNQFLLSIWQRQVPFSRTVFVRTPWRSCDAAVTLMWCCRDAAVTQPRDVLISTRVPTTTTTFLARPSQLPFGLCDFLTKQPFCSQREDIDNCISLSNNLNYYQILFKKSA